MRSWREAISGLVVATLLVACGGADEEAKQVQPPAPPGAPTTLAERACPDRSILTYEDFGGPFIRRAFKRLPAAARRLGGDCWRGLPALIGQAHERQQGRQSAHRQHEPKIQPPRIRVGDPAAQRRADEVGNDLRCADEAKDLAALLVAEQVADGGQGGGRHCAGADSLHDAVGH